MDKDGSLEDSRLMVAASRGFEGEFDPDRYAQFFDPTCRSGRARVFQARLALVRELLAGENGPLLDVACGTGEITEAALGATSAEGSWVNDVSEAMLAACHTRIGRAGLAAELHCSCSDVFELLPRLPVEAFGTVLCSGLVAHVGRLSELMEGLARACRPGGVVIFQSSLLDHLGIRITRAVTRRLPRRFPHPQHYYWRREIVEEAAAHGLRLEVERRYGLLLPFGDRLLGPLNGLLEDRLGRRDRMAGEALFKFRKTGRPNG